MKWFSIPFLTHVFLFIQQIAGQTMTKRLNAQIQSKWAKAEVSIEEYNKVLKEQNSGMLKIKN